MVLITVHTNNNNKKSEDKEKGSSPAPESDSSDTPLDLNNEILNYWKQFAKFCKSSHESMALDVMKDGVTFDVLGPLRAYYVKMTSLIRRIINLHEKLESEKEKKAYSVIDHLSDGNRLASCIVYIVKAFRENLKEISTDTKCVAVLQIVGPSFNDLLQMVKAKMYKEEAVELQHCITCLFDAIKLVVTEPLDNMTLEFVDKLLTSCLNQYQNAKLKQSTVAMWKTIFSTSKELKPSEELRNALISASKRYPIGGLGDGTEFNDVQMKAPLTPKGSGAVSKKRMMTLLNEDSVDYVPIVSNSAKKMKLTEHQKEKFLENREQLPYMDEDSVQLKGNVLTNIKSQFDVENSVDSLSSSVSKTATAAAQSPEKPVQEPSVPINTETVGNEKAAEATTSSAEKTVPVVTLDDSVEEVAISDKAETTQKKKRSIAVKLDFDTKYNFDEDDDIPLAQLRNKENKKQIKSTSAGECLEILSVSSSSSVLCLDSGDDSEVSKDYSDTPVGKSRRSLAKKATPQRYNPPTKEVLGIDHSDSLSVRKRGKPKKVEVSAQKASAKINEKVQLNSPVVTMKSDTLLPAAPTNKSPQKQAAVAQAPSNTIEESGLSDVQIRTSPTEKVYSSEDMTTPEKISPEEPMITPKTGTVACYTPGILKKFGTPSASEKKRLRVHFRGVESESECSLDGTNANTGSTSQVNSDLTGPSELDAKTPIFPQLSECTDALSKILPKIVPRSMAGANFVRNVLDKKKMTTIGQLASLDSRTIASLPFKIPRFETVHAALQEYHNTLNSAESEAPVTTVESISNDSVAVIDEITAVPTDVIAVQDVVVEVSVQGAIAPETVSADVEDGRDSAKLSGNTPLETPVMEEVMETDEQPTVTPTHSVGATLFSSLLCEELGSINGRLVQLSAEIPESLDPSKMKEALTNITLALNSLGALQQNIVTKLQ